MTGTGITLKQLLLDEDGKHSFMKGVTAPLSDATKGVATTRQMVRLNAQLGVIAKAGAKAFMASDIKGVNVGIKGLNVGVAGALAGMPKMQLPSMAFVQFLANNPAFQVQQRQIVAGIIAGNLATKLDFGPTLIQVAQVIRAGAEPAPDPVSEERTYGSHQLSHEMTVSLFLGIWSIVHEYVQTDTEKHLLETHVITLFILVLVWCTAAALP